MKSIDYQRLLSESRDVLRTVDGDGWLLAKNTYEGVMWLMHSQQLTQGRALEVWSKDVAMDRFSKTNARRYYDVWRKYGRKRERDADGKPLSFAEHYAIVRGGKNAKVVMEQARARGMGAQAAAQNMTVFNGNAVTGALSRVVDVSAALQRLVDRQNEGHLLTESELQLLDELEKRIRKNLGLVKKMHQK